MDRIDAWEQLSVFESHDFIFHWYETHNKRKPNASLIRSISSCFVQGREYFSSAANASLSVRPLLLYYGVISLSRGLILLRNSYAREATLKPSHGLEVVDWSNKLSNGISSILDLEIQATNGTFTELCEVTKNIQWTASWRKPDFVEGHYWIKWPQPQFVNGAYKISFDDILSRDIHLISLYEKTTKRKNKVYLSEILTNSSGIDVGIYRNPLTDIDSNFFLDNGFLPKNKGERLNMPILYKKFNHLDKNIPPENLPYSEFIKNSGLFIVRDFQFGDKLSEILRIYLASYIIGMLVRYYPSIWISLIQNEKGDMPKPLIFSETKNIQQRFPNLVYRSLT